MFCSDLAQLSAYTLFNIKTILKSTNAIFDIITYTHPFCTFYKKTPKDGYTRKQPIHFSMIPKIWIKKKKKNF